MRGNQAREARIKRTWMKKYAQPAVKNGKMSDQEFAAAVVHDDADSAIERLEQIRAEHDRGGARSYGKGNSYVARMRAYRARNLLGKYQELCEDVLNPVRVELNELRAHLYGNACAG